MQCLLALFLLGCFTFAVSDQKINLQKIVAIQWYNTRDCSDGTGSCVPGTPNCVYLGQGVNQAYSGSCSLYDTNRSFWSLTVTGNIVSYGVVCSSNSCSECQVNGTTSLNTCVALPTGGAFIALSPDTNSENLTIYNPNDTSCQLPIAPTGVVSLSKCTFIPFLNFSILIQIVSRNNNGLQSIGCWGCDLNDPLNLTSCLVGTSQVIQTLAADIGDCINPLQIWGKTFLYNLVFRTNSNIPSTAPASTLSPTTEVPAITPDTPSNNSITHMFHATLFIVIIIMYLI